MLVYGHEHLREPDTCQHPNYISPIFASFHTTKLIPLRYTNLSINQSINQASKQSVNQSIKQPIDQTNNKSIKQPIYQHNIHNIT